MKMLNANLAYKYLMEAEIQNPGAWVQYSKDIEDAVGKWDCSTEDFLL